MNCKCGRALETPGRRRCQRCREAGALRAQRLRHRRRRECECEDCGAQLQWEEVEAGRRRCEGCRRRPRLEREAREAKAVQRRASGRARTRLWRARKGLGLPLNPKKRPKRSGGAGGATK
jgi:hypothetical protein